MYCPPMQALVCCISMTCTILYTERMNDLQNYIARLSFQTGDLVVKLETKRKFKHQAKLSSHTFTMHCSSVWALTAVK